MPGLRADLMFGLLRFLFDFRFFWRGLGPRSGNEASLLKEVFYFYFFIKYEEIYYILEMWYHNIKTVMIILGFEIFW